MLLTELSETALQPLAAMLKALGDPLRLRIMCILHQGECSVNAITAALQAKQPNVSKHLHILALAGLVRARKVGVQTLYGTGGALVDHLCRNVCRTFVTLQERKLRIVRNVAMQRSRGARRRRAMKGVGVI